MLESLHVKNLALMEEAEVSFSEGFNILTGETGAGKSILIGSINLALGEKVQKEMLREGAGGELEPALVELVFRVTSDRQREQLAGLSVTLEDDEVIFSRRIVNGRGTAKVNSESMPASKVREIAGILIDIHGQNEHQSLLSKKKHLEILDEYAGEKILGPKKKLAESYRAYRELADELAAAGMGDEERLREISFLEYEVREIEDAALREGEDDELEEHYRLYQNAQKVTEAAGAAYECTGGLDGAGEKTGRALHALSPATAYDGRLAQLEGELSEIDGLISDFNRELSEYMGSLDFDGEDSYETERRLNEVNRLKEKYGGSIPAVLSSLEEKRARLGKLKDYDAYLEDLRARLGEEEERLREACGEVSSIRKEYAKRLTAAATDALRDLNFLDVRFEMSFSATESYTANGCDDAEFLISTNPGEPLKPLGKIASGGELSRVMLALKTVLADEDAVETLIFDEIDSGISGRTAQMVSEKMSVLGRSHQVICITHLPQIAAMADAHYLIEKSVVDKSTISTIRRLGEEESVSELARMLGGVEITETVLKNAEEMKRLAAERKAGA